jgi:hypothetical protein
MADTYTGFLNLTKPEVGASRDVWGDKWNANATVLDNWAKATDLLAKDALAKSGVTTRNAQNALVYTEQLIAGPVRLSGYLTAGAGITIPRDIAYTYGAGYLIDRAGFGELVTGPHNIFRVVNNAYSQEMFKVSPTEFLYKGSAIWTALNLSAPFDRNQPARQELAGPFSINMAAPYFDLTYGNVIRSRQVIDGSGTWILRDGDNGDNKFYVTRDGGAWFKEIGGLNARIESRGGAYRDDAVNRANAYYEARLPLRRNVSSEQDIASDLFVNKAYPAFNLLYPAVKWWGFQVRENGWLYFPEDHNATFNIAFVPGGNIWSNAFGGTITDRIESRGGAYRDDAVNRANQYYEARAPIRANVGGRQEMSGALAVTEYLDIIRGGVLRYRLVVDGSGNMLHQNGDNGDNFFYINTGGAVWTKQFGDLNNRIEDRAYAWANDRLAIATARINNKSIRFIYAGDLNSDWNRDQGGFKEPYGGAFITTMNWYSTGQIGDHVGGARWRYIQMSNSDGNWYAVGYS